MSNKQNLHKKVADLEEKISELEIADGGICVHAHLKDELKAISYQK